MVEGRGVFNNVYKTIQKSLEKSFFPDVVMWGGHMLSLFGEIILALISVLWKDLVFVFVSINILI